MIDWSQSAVIRVTIFHSAITPFKELPYAYIIVPHISTHSLHTNILHSKPQILRFNSWM